MSQISAYVCKKSFFTKVSQRSAYVCEKKKIDIKGSQGAAIDYIKLFLTPIDIMHTYLFSFYLVFYKG